MKNLLLSCVILFCSSAFAWTPTKTITANIGFAPGSGNELSFRIVSSVIEKNNPNINFVVINRAGADGVVAMNEFIKTQPDGYNLYVASHQGIWVTADYFNSAAKKYTLDDFEYGISLAKSPLAIIVGAKSSIVTPTDLLNHLKSDGNKLIAAGSGAHKLASDFIANSLNFPDGKIENVSYKGPAQAAMGVASGDTEIGIVPLAVAATLAKSGKIRIVGICGEFPIKGVEAVPLMNKFVPGLNVYAAWGIILPKNTPKEIVDWYVTNFGKALKSQEVQVAFEQNYMFNDSRENTPEGFKNSMLSLRKHWIPILEKMAK